MIWKWSLIESDSTTTVIAEPVGWDGVGYSLQRNIIHHGIFQGVDTGGFQFVDDAYDILLSAYNTDGANADVALLIEYKCTEEDSYTNYFQGKFDFNTFERQCADYCFIKCSVTSTTCVDVFLSRMGQDVNPEDVTNFDGEAITALSPTTLNIYGQEIFLQNTANHDGGGNWNATITDLSGLTGNRFYDIPIYLPNNPLIEIGEFNVNNVNPSVVAKNDGLDNIVFPLTDGIDDFDNLYQFMYLYAPNNDECVSQLQTDWVCKGEFNLTPNYNGSVTITLRSARLNPLTNGDFVDLGSVIIGASVALSNGITTTINFDESFTGLPNQPQSGSYIHYYWHVVIFKSSASATDITDIVINYDGGGVNTYTMNADSACPQSTADSYLLPDLLKRLPASYMSTDCPELTIDEELEACLEKYAATKGSMIRQVTQPSAPKLFTSFEWLFDQCRRVFNIGWGFDNDDTVLRIGNIEDFYQSAVNVNVGLIDKATFTTAQDLICGSIAIGYNKWEAEEYNGLDEMNTERRYRRNIDSNEMQMDLMSDIITAGYTIEITRRKNQANTGTSDWRYDDDLFLINCTDVDGDLYAVSGVEVNPSNIYSPSTRINYALTPARNMMRWFRSICAANPTIANDQLIFTSGTGNYIAQGQMLSYCPVEGSTLSESETIEVSNFDNDYYITPVWKTIYVEFNAPLNMSQFEAIKANPYGAIQFVCFDDVYRGSIVTMSHDPNVELAKFKLLLLPD